MFFVAFINKYDLLICYQVGAYLWRQIRKNINIRTYVHYVPEFTAGGRDYKASLEMASVQSSDHMNT